MNLKKFVYQSLTYAAHCGLTRRQVLRVALLKAKDNQGLWPFNSMSAHRYALRKLRQHGDGDVMNDASFYESLVSAYVNNPENYDKD